MTGLLRSAELGAASGLRSMAAPAGLSRRLAGSRGDRPGGVLADLLARTPTRSLLEMAALGEMIADKLPGIPDRIEPGPLLGRAVFGALAGGVLARRNRESGALGALLGGAAALLAAHAGFRARRALTRTAGLPDLPVALCEDALALALARHAVRA
jgi:uncharacterized membrane protein